MKNQTILSKRLRKARQEKGLTQKQFVEGLSMTAATLSAYENGVSSPSVVALAEIAEKNNLSLDWLMGLKDDNSMNSKIETIADLIKIIVALSDIGTYNNNNSAEFTADFSAFRIEVIPGHGVGWDEAGYTTLSDNKIVFYSAFEDFNDFFVNLCKMQELVHQGTIIREVLDSWVEKTINDLGALQISEIPDNFDRFKIIKIQDLINGND